MEVSYIPYCETWTHKRGRLEGSEVLLGHGRHVTRGGGLRLMQMQIKSDGEESKAYRYREASGVEQAGQNGIRVFVFVVVFSLDSACAVVCGGGGMVCMVWMGSRRDMTRPDLDDFLGTGFNMKCKPRQAHANRYAGRGPVP